jgi:hypothetical protein
MEYPTYVASQSGSLLKAYFQQGDWSYDWILAYLVGAEYCIGDIGF